LALREARVLEPVAAEALHARLKVFSEEFAALAGCWEDNRPVEEFVRH
jgi:hypothetical protein